MSMNNVGASPPVTVLITRRVRHGRAQEFEALMADMQAAAAKFPGHMGGFLISPERSEPDCYRILFAFDTDAHLQDWNQSRERRRLLQRVAAVTHGDAAMRVLSGLETWFELPTARTKLPPPRWKMAIVTWMGIFPLALLISRTVMPGLGNWVHPLLVTMLSTALITIAMTWVVMPNLVPVFAGWYIPHRPRTPRRHQPLRTIHQRTRRQRTRRFEGGNERECTRQLLVQQRPSVRRILLCGDGRIRADCAAGEASDLTGSRRYQRRPRRRLKRLRNNCFVKRAGSRRPRTHAKRIDKEVDQHAHFRRKVSAAWVDCVHPEFGGSKFRQNLHQRTRSEVRAHEKRRL